MRVAQVLVEGPTPVPSSGCRGSVHTKAGAASLPGMMLRLCIRHMPRSSRASSEPRSSPLPCGAVRGLEGSLRSVCVSPTRVGWPTPGHTGQVDFHDFFVSYG